MEWTLEERGRALVGHPVGRVDATSWEAFSTRLTEAVERANASRSRLVVDFSSLDLASGGLRALTLARKAADAAGVEIVLAGANEAMREMLAISRYDQIFPVAEDVDSAL